MNLLLGRPVARLLAKQLLAGAAESAGRGARGIRNGRRRDGGRGRCKGRTDQDAGILADHHLGIAAHQTGRRRLRLDQRRRHQRDRLNLLLSLLGTRGRTAERGEENTNLQYVPDSKAPLVPVTFIAWTWVGFKSVNPCASKSQKRRGNS